jgi:hypothetical protein
VVHSRVNASPRPNTRAGVGALAEVVAVGEEAAVVAAEDAGGKYSDGSEATMIVDLYDAKNQTLVWRGVAQNTLNNNGNQNQEMINKAVQKMFKQWPKN